MTGIDWNLAAQHLAMIDPSGQLPIATGYRLGPNEKDFRGQVLPDSAAVLRYFKSVDPAGHMWTGAAPRSTRARGNAKGTAALSWVVWADFDQRGKHNPTGAPLAIPDALARHVRLVRSGTPGNAHPYLLLAEPLKKWQNMTLANYLWRKVLCADAKHADNSLLRLPGTHGKNGAEVTVEPSRGRVVPVAPIAAVRVLAGLLGMSRDDVRALRDRLAAGVRGVRGSGRLMVVDVPDDRLALLPRDRRLDLRADTFRTRGNRSDARIGFWKDFWRAGLTIHETYTLMRGFEPMQDVDDWEADLVRCWSKYESGAF